MPSLDISLLKTYIKSYSYSTKQIINIYQILNIKKPLFYKE